MDPSKISNAIGMKAEAIGDLKAGAALAVSKIETEFFIGDEKIGSVMWTRLTEATIADYRIGGTHG